jgi:hypothetical protein
MKMMNKKKGKKTNIKKIIKEEELKIKIMSHELLWLLSNVNSLVILQSFKSLFTDSSHVKFGLPLALFPLPV